MSGRYSNNFRALVSTSQSADKFKMLMFLFICDKRSDLHWYFYFLANAWNCRIWAPKPLLNGISFVAALPFPIQVCTYDSSLCLFVLKGRCVPLCWPKVYTVSLWSSYELVGMWVWMCSGLPFMNLGCLLTQSPFRTKLEMFCREMFTHLYKLKV